MIDVAYLPALYIYEQYDWRRYLGPEWTERS